jgi:hypothetical protein
VDATGEICEYEKSVVGKVSMYVSHYPWIPEFIYNAVDFWERDNELYQTWKQSKREGRIGGQRAEARFCEICGQSPHVYVDGKDGWERVFSEMHPTGCKTGHENCSRRIDFHTFEVKAVLKRYKFSINKFSLTENAKTNPVYVFFDEKNSNANVPMIGYCYAKDLLQFCGEHYQLLKGFTGPNNFYWNISIDELIRFGVLQTCNEDEFRELFKYEIQNAIDGGTFNEAICN